MMLVPLILVDTIPKNLFYKQKALQLNTAFNMSAFGI